MPYKKRYRRRGYRKRGKRVSTKPLTGLQRVASTVGKLWRGYKNIKRLVNVEWKLHDYQSSTGVLSTGFMHAISLIAEGDDYNVRDGKSILAKNLTLNMSCIHNASGDTQQIVRVMLILDKDSREAAPNVSDFVSSYNSLYAIDGSKHLKRYKILMDRKMYVGASTDSFPSILERKYFFELNHHITFDDTTANQDAAQLGHLYVLTIGSQLTNNYPTLAFTARLRFIDN